LAQPILTYKPHFLHHLLLQVDVSSPSLRQRHASADHIGLSSSAYASRVSWFDDIRTSADTEGRGNVSSSTAAAAAGGRVIPMDQLFSTSDQDNAAAAGGGGTKNVPDELDIALSALKDCDTDYSKFVLENEDGAKK
jgi:hypothetical protein